MHRLLIVMWALAPLAASGEDMAPSTLGKWAPDYTTRERAALADVTSHRGGTVTVLAEYVMAQVTASLVEPPSFLPAAVQGGSR